MMRLENNPAVAGYREGKEAFTIHADGAISRPAIGLKPSGGWTFQSLGQYNRGVFENVGGLVAIIRTMGGRDLTGLHVADIDHGTYRVHGEAISNFWLEPNAKLWLPEIERLHAERFERERVARDAAALEARERVTEAKGAALCWQCDDLAFPIELWRGRGKDSFAVIYGKQVKDGLPYEGAADELGRAIMHALACDERLG